MLIGSAEAPARAHEGATRDRLPVRPDCLPVAMGDVFYHSSDSVRDDDLEQIREPFQAKVPLDSAMPEEERLRLPASEAQVVPEPDDLPGPDLVDPTGHWRRDAGLHAAGATPVRIANRVMRLCSSAECVARRGRGLQRAEKGCGRPAARRLLASSCSADMRSSGAWPAWRPAVPCPARAAGSGPPARFLEVGRESA